MKLTKAYTKIASPTPNIKIESVEVNPMNPRSKQNPQQAIYLEGTIEGKNFRTAVETTRTHTKQVNINVIWFQGEGISPEELQSMEEYLTTVLAGKLFSRYKDTLLNTYPTQNSADT